MQILCMYVIVLVSEIVLHLISCCLHAIHVYSVISDTFIIHSICFFYSEAIGPVFLLFLCYGLAITPWMYVYSFLFQSPTTAYVMLFCLNFFSGLVLLVVDAIVVLEALDYDAVC